MTSRILACAERRSLGMDCFDYAPLSFGTLLNTLR